jgi:hypothetical protein
MEHFVGPTFNTAIGLAVALAGVCLVLRLLPPNRRVPPNNSSKPTPLRGAA